MYWCNMIELDGRHHNSDTALLTVNPLPPKYKPSCNIYPSQPRVGESVSLNCTLSERDPPSLLTWFESTSSVPIQIEDETEVNPGETYAVERELTESDNMREFTCVAGPHLNGPNCSITPLQIPTTVSISPSHLTLLEHQNATFTCDLKSTPQQLADRYEWRVLLVDKGEVKVNRDTVQNLDGRFKLDQNGQTLQIIDVTLREFNFSKIRCIAFQDSRAISSVNDSLLFVLPLTTATPPKTNIVSVFDNDDNTLQGSGVIIIVGGLIGVIFFLIIIALLGCYLIKHKHNLIGPGQTTATLEERQPSGERVTVSSEDQNGQTYDEIPWDVAGDRNARMSSSATKEAEVLHACADKTGRNEIKRYGVPAPSTTSQDGYTVTNGDRVDEDIGHARDQAIYTTVNKPKKTKSNHTGKNDHRKVNQLPDEDGKESDTPAKHLLPIVTSNLLSALRFFHGTWLLNTTVCFAWRMISFSLLLIFS